MVDVNRMTHKLQEALQQAGGLAARRNHQGIDVEHLLLALLDQEGGLAANLLEVAGVAPRAVRDAVERELDRKPQVKQAAGGPVAGVPHPASRRSPRPRPRTRCAR